MRSFTTSPGKAGLRVQTGDRHTRDAMARRAGVPRWRGSVVNLETPSHRIFRSPIGMEQTDSNELDDIRNTAVNLLPYKPTSRFFEATGPARGQSPGGAGRLRLGVGPGQVWARWDLSL
jgi:hypothetical protein